MAAAVVSAAAGCQMEEKVTVDPSAVLAPVLHDPGFPEVLTMTSLNQSEEVSFTWDAADMGFSSQLNYSIEVAVIRADEEGGAEMETEKIPLGGGVSATSTKIKYEDINYALVQSLGVEPDTEVKTNFYLKASLGVRPFYSLPVQVRIVTTSAQKIFPYIYFMGSYSTWNFTMAQLMYDYAENGLKYQAIIDFGENFMTTTKGGFKLTPKADWTAEFAEPEAWDKDYEDRLASGALEKDPEEVQFATKGGDCKRYSQSHRYYHFSLSMDNYKFTMEKAFDNISLVWNGETMPLTFHSAQHAQKFYADVTVGTDDRFYVSLDETATVFAADENGTNGLLHEVKADEETKEIEVIVTPGKYRLYIDLNNWDAPTYEFNRDMFEKEEGAASVGYKGWAICGFMNNWDGDLPMQQLEGDKACWWVARNVLLKKDYDFCFRKDGAGAIVFKGGGFKINQPVWHYGGGADIHITQTGTYDIWLNPNNGCCWVLTPGGEPAYGDCPVRPEGASDWTISGPLTQGGLDIYMYETEYGYMAQDVELSYGDEFYFRCLYRDDHSVRTTSYAGMREDNVGKAKEGRGVIKALVEPGRYDICLTNACDTVYLMHAGTKVTEAVSNFSTDRPDGAVWGLCGSFTDWEEDLWLEEEDGYYVAKNLALRASDALKFRKDASWGDDGANGYGVDAMAKAGYWYPLYQKGGDITIGTTGIYDIYMSLDNSKCFVLSAGSKPSDAMEGKAGFSAWSVSGDHNGWGDTPMVEEDGYHVAKGVKLYAGNKFKLRKDHDWKEQRSVSKTLVANAVYGVSDSGDCVVGSEGVYDIYLSADLTKMYFMTTGTPVSEAVDGSTVVEPSDKMVQITIYGQTAHNYLYAWWDGGAEISGNWPGTAAAGTEIVDGVEYRKWTLSVSESAMAAKTAQFIFTTSADGPQTADSDPVTVTDGLILIEKNGVPMPKAEVQGPENMSEWVIVGDFIGEWGLSVNMFEDGDYYVAYKVGITAGSVFKFRKGSGWDEQKTYNGPVTANTRYSLGDAGYDDKSSVAVAGVYDIYVSKDMSSMYFMEEGKTPAEASDNGSDSNTNPEIPDTPDTPDTPVAQAGPWSICGSFLSWSSDVLMYADGGYYVATGVTIPAAGEFKFRKDKGWGEVRTYKGTVTANTRYEVENNGAEDANIIVSAGGTYDVYISLNADHFYLMEQGKKPGEN